VFGETEIRHIFFHLPSVTSLSLSERHCSLVQDIVCVSFPLQVFLPCPPPGMHCLFLVFKQSELQ
jgi:hypothetical protein